LSQVLIYFDVQPFIPSYFSYEKNYYFLFPNLNLPICTATANTIDGVTSQKNE